MTLDPNEAKLVESLRLQAQPNDVLYLGNSVTFQGINPKVIDDACGVKSYNLAVGGSSPIEQDLILRAYVRHNPTPKLVVIGVTPNLGAFGDDLRPTVYLALEEPEKSYYAEFLQENGLAPLPIGDEIALRVPAYRHRTTLEPMLKFFVRGEARRPSFVQGHLTYREVGAVPARLPVQRTDWRKSWTAFTISPTNTMGRKFCWRCIAMPFRSIAISPVTATSPWDLPR